jgi:transglutaminase-like putative cysteine protease
VRAPAANRRIPRESLPAAARQARSPFGRYGATVDIDHHRQSAALLEEVPIARIPPQVLPFIYTEPYCEADRLRRFAGREFGHLRPGYWRVQAIHDWVRQRTVFTPGTTNSSSSAMDTLVEQVGVCRDFAHLMIALCRAVNIPARFVSGIDYGAAVQLGPPDFHAYVETFLGDRRYLFDPTGITAPMGLVRIGTGRDAADVSLGTIFGAVRSDPPIIAVAAWTTPRAVSTSRSTACTRSHDDGHARGSGLTHAQSRRRATVEWCE